MPMEYYWTWTILALLALAFLHSCVFNNRKKKLPPGPTGLPLIGHFHILGKHLHQQLHQLAKKHGPIMFLRFGFVPSIVVSSPQAAEQFLKTYDLVFASRPCIESGKYLSYEQRNFSFSQYGPYWRKMRKLCTLELLSNLKINSFQPIRKEELELIVQSLKQAAQDHSAVDLSSKVSSFSTDISCRMVFGRKYADEEFYERGFKALIREGMQLPVAPNLADYFPFLSVLDLQGFTRRMKAMAKVFDNFFEKIIDEHAQTGQKTQRKDFVDTMMAIMESGDVEFQLDRGHVKATMMDMLTASTDTSASAIEWVLSELLKHPRVMKKVQEELEQAVGLDRMVEESDLEMLEYLEMVVKETLRLHPVVPLLLPREAREDCTVDGLHIPKKSRVIINVWAIGRDPKVWTEPERFYPERFIGSNIDVRGRDFQLLPFGSGRRSCPGMQLGLVVVKLAVAQFLHCFEWELPNGMLPAELDMREELGVVMSRAKHLMAIPTYRLRK